MKKFIGNVNGKEYTSISEFKKAISEAVESGETPLSITSYYKECDGTCECNGKHCCGCLDETDTETTEDKTEEKTPKKECPFSTFVVLETSLKDENGDYIMPTNIDVLLDNASNLEELAEEAKKYVNSLTETICDIDGTCGYFQSKIENLEKSLARTREHFNNLKVTKNINEKYKSYYEKLKTKIDEAISRNTFDESAKTDVKEETNDEKNDSDDGFIFATDALKKNTEAYDLMKTTFSSFSKYLNDLGFFKK